MASVPVLLITVIGIKYLLSHPYLYRWRPTWTQSFVVEGTEPDEFPTATPPQRTSKAIILCVLALAVFGTGIARIVMLPLFFGVIALTVAWVSFVLFCFWGKEKLSVIANASRASLQL